MVQVIYIPDMQTSSHFSRAIGHWIPIAFVTTALIAFSYVGIQQNYRQNANDPQIQLSQDVATALDAGATSTDIVPTSTVDISKSLSSYIFIYDKDNKLLGSDVTLNGKAPSFPTGVLDNARKNGTDRVTWQPEAGVRSAVVAAKASNGDVVVVGRSMKEIENRINQLGLIALGAWGVSVIGSLLLIWGYEVMKNRVPKVKVVAEHKMELTPEPHHEEKKAE